MRRLLLVTVPLLSLLVAMPGFCQGVQTPEAPNATPPAGTASTATTSDKPTSNATPPGGAAPNVTSPNTGSPGGAVPNATKPD